MNAQELFYNQLDHVDALIDTGKVDQALDKLASLSKQGSADYLVQSQFVIVYLLLQQISKAKESLKAILVNDPDCFQGKVLRSLMLTREGNQIDSLGILESISSSTKESAATYLFLLASNLQQYRCKKDFQIAISILLNNFKPSEGDSFFWLQKGIDAELFKESQILSENIINQNPLNWQSYIGSALLYSKMGDLEKAKTSLTKAESFADFKDDEFIREIKKIIN